MRPTRSEITETCIKMIHSYVPELKDAELTEESTVNTDAALDSMSMILVITKLESAFDVIIPEDEWEHIETLGQLVDKIEENLPEEQTKA